MKLTLANTTGSASKLLAVTGAGKVVEIDVVDLQDAYDNSTDPEIVTDAKGALTLKRGSTQDSDSVLEIQNGAGSNTTILTGNGQLQLDSAIVQPQIVFDSNGGMDLNHYIQYNPSGQGGVTLKSQQVGSEVTTLELNRNSSGEFKLSGNSSDTTKSAQLINTYSVPSDEALLQLISRNDKTATKSATITVSSGSTDLATDSEISLSADKVSTVGAVVNLGSTTAPASPVGGDIWYDGTNVNIQGSIVTQGTGAKQIQVNSSDNDASVRISSNSVNWTIGSDFSDSSNLVIGRSATLGSFPAIILDASRNTTISNDLNVTKVLNLASTTNGSPTTGDIWLDSTSGAVEIEGDLKVNASNINFNGLPTSSAGLSSGDLWNDAGTLKIV